MKLLKLKGRITEMGMTQLEIAKKLNLTAQSLNAKLNGRANFNIAEVHILSDILAIDNLKEFFLIN